MPELKDRILAAAADDLTAIETALLENLTPHLDLVKQVAHHILFSGGKRLRPLLMVLSARLCGYRGNYDKTFSVIFEYLHAATLLHDDLVDGAALRRGRPAAHAVWDNATAVLVGDFLLAKGLSIAAETENARIIRIIADITENMSQGEIHQLQRRGAVDLTEEEYHAIIRCKTAVLFQGACRISAILAAASPEEESALAAFGLHLGMAFQMIDDLLDYTLDSNTLGKKFGADLKEGKLTLPVIYALQRASAEDRTTMTAIITDPVFTKRRFIDFIALLKKYDGIDDTLKLARQHVAAAEQALTVFQPSPTKSLLMDIAAYTLSRRA